MNSFLLTHNPNKFKWKTINEEYERFKDGEEVVIRWNTKSKKIKLGDRVFLMRLGSEPKGIYLSGVVTTECFKEVSWKDKNKMCTYITFKLDKMILPDKEKEKMLLIDDLKSIDSEYNWTPQGSGTSIPSNIAGELEKQWLAEEKKYEREVISIPAAGTIDLIYKYKIHAHPIKKGYGYKKSLYYTFRGKLGVMEKIFMTKKTIDIDPYNIGDLSKDDLNEDEIKRVLGYVKERNNTFGFESEEFYYKVYILENEINLSNKPKYPGQNNHTYFTLYELFSKTEGLEKSSTDVKYSEEDNEKNVLVDEDIFEGDKLTIAVNKYERSRKARQACLNYYGYKCSVCGFDFEEAYGEIGKNVIEVHHLKPLYSIAKKYKVDFIKDLIPVCSNCHTIIHRRKIPFTIEEMKEKFKNKSLK